MAEVLLKCTGITKTFGITRALVDVNLEICSGEIRGLIGENGSGKSTLTSIIAGMQSMDAGSMTYCSDSYTPHSAAFAQEKGISMIVQEMGTMPGTSVATNIFVGHYAEFLRHGLLNHSIMNKKADEILAEIGAEGIKGDMKIDRLNFEDRKIVELARAMYYKPKLLIIDETTTALAQKGRSIIYKLIQDMRNAGNAVLFISHDLDELLRVCTSITVLRDGHFIDNLSGERMTIPIMRELMVGREFKDNYYRTDFDGSFSDEVVLDAKSVTIDANVMNLNLQLHKGEILGLGGLANSGMHEIGRVLYGIDKPLTGEIIVKRFNKRLKNTTDAVRMKMAYVSKNRDQKALIQEASIKDNIVIASYDQLKKAGLITRKAETKLTKAQIDILKIKCTSDVQQVKELSGGNKQKVVFGRWIANDSEILILDCPTRGIDIGVKAAMYSLIYEFKKQGKSIVLISEELQELIGMSDRILIIKDGRISGEFVRNPELNEHTIIEYMI